LAYRSVPSRIGYRNPHPLETEYCTLEDFLASVDRHVESGRLINRNELYLPIRLKLEGGSARISHLEVRLLDLDPNDVIGLSLDSLQLLHLFCVFALLEPEGEAFDVHAQQQADALQNRIAVGGFSPEGWAGCCQTVAPLDLREEALQLADKLERVYRLMPVHREEGTPMRVMLEQMRSLIRGEVPHPSAQLIEAVLEKGFIPYHLERALRSREELEGKGFRFHGLEDMELSTQLVLREAVKRGVHFDILDRRENFVRLHKLGKEEYVMQATRTSLDRYSHVLLMNNKLTTKLVLARAGIRVPEGYHFTDVQAALACWEMVKGRAVVVKPKSTNFGIGINILKENLRLEDFERAVRIAFAEDVDILVEFFVPGKEYRFFLIDSQVVGILHRVPANVTGDGVHSIEELVEIKNRDPLRGKGYRTPLEKIQLGDTERWFLEGQGSKPEDVPAPGVRVFLRENSNISTGGDSIDMTERVHVSYHQIASRAAQALGVRITGLDMMIEDIHAPATDGNHAIIEMNYNPAIHIHCFPFEGKKPLPGQGAFE
jgi:glutamate--cysteine ligase